jgi:AraC-like DNA-binding protein
VGVLIRTQDLPAGDRMGAWRGVVCDTLGPLDVRIDRDTPLQGEIEAGEVGAVKVGRVQTSTPSSVHRTAGLIRRAGPGMYRVVLALSGRPTVAQDGRSSQLRPGELAIYDFARPYQLGYDQPVELGVFSFPYEALALPGESIARLTAVAIDGEGAVGALAAPLLRRVVLDHDRYQPGSGGRLSTVMADLVTTAIAERVEQLGAVPDDTRDRMILLRIHAFVEQHLGELDLGPRTIAAAHGVSVRQLHRLFEAESTTVAAWIRHRRLERCRADLADAALRGLSVSAVAARWGLPDAAHFSRLFRQAYGMAPRDLRALRPA